MVNHVSFIWNIAESLRGPFKPSEYGSVVLPFTVLRRLDAVQRHIHGQQLPDVLFRKKQGH